MGSDELEAYVANTGDLPPMPDIAARVLRAVESGECSSQDLRDIIERDPAIVARILKVANSALYGFTRQIDTLGHALALLGMHTVRNLVLAASLRNVFKRFGLMEQTLFEHAALTAAVSLRLARELEGKCDPEEVFVAGLLHDLGKIMLVNGHREAYEGVFTRAYTHEVSSVDIEREVFGFHHGELGAEVARRWQLSELHELTIRYHHEIEALPSAHSELRSAIALVAVASSALGRLGFGRRSPSAHLQEDAVPAWRLLGLAPEAADEVLVLCADEAERARALAS